MPNDLAAVVMAGGLGTRMRSPVPKHLHPLLGRRMVDWVIESARPLDPQPLVVVTSPQSADAFDGLAVAVQERPLGTGDAVRSARAALDGRVGDVLVPKNVQGALYLTDAVRFLVEDGDAVAVHQAADPVETEGVNTRAELAAAGAALRDRINEAHMLAGVTIVDPGSTWIDPTVEVEPDAVIYPFTVLRGTTRIGGGAEVGPHAVAVEIGRAHV